MLRSSSRKLDSIGDQFTKTAMAFWLILVNRLASQAGLDVDRPDEGHVAEQVLEGRVPLHEQEFFDQP
jgi:hypothetical protein